MDSLRAHSPPSSPTSPPPSSPPSSSPYSSPALSPPSSRSSSSSSSSSSSNNGAISRENFVCFVRACHDFEAEMEDEISFKKGSYLGVIQKIGCEDEGFWKGHLIDWEDRAEENGEWKGGWKKVGAVGLFQSDYVYVLSPEEEKSLLLLPLLAYVPPSPPSPSALPITPLPLGLLSPTLGVVEEEMEREKEMCFSPYHVLNRRALMKRLYEKKRKEEQMQRKRQEKESEVHHYRQQQLLWKQQREEEEEDDIVWEKKKIRPDVIDVVIIDDDDDEEELQKRKQKTMTNRSNSSEVGDGKKRKKKKEQWTTRKKFKQREGEVVFSLGVRGREEWKGGREKDLCHHFISTVHSMWPDAFFHLHTDDSIEYKDYKKIYQLCSGKCRFFRYYLMGERRRRGLDHFISALRHRSLWEATGTVVSCHIWENPLNVLETLRGILAEMEAEKKSVCHYVWKAMGQRCTKTPYGEGQGWHLHTDGGLVVWMNGDQRKVVNSAEKSYTDFVIEKTKDCYFFPIECDNYLLDMFLEETGGLYDVLLRETLDPQLSTKPQQTTETNHKGGNESLSSIDTKSLEVEDIFHSLITPNKWMRFQTCRPHVENNNFLPVLGCLNRLHLTREDMRIVKDYPCHTGLTYGEALPRFVKNLVDLWSIGRNDVFVDIGSGIGGVCFMIRLLSDCRQVYGIEIRKNLHHLAVGYRNYFEDLLKHWVLNSNYPATHRRYRIPREETKETTKEVPKFQVGDSINDMMVIPSMGSFTQPESTKGTSFSYHLICGKAEEEGKKTVEWSQVTKVYINNLKFHEEIQLSLSRFLKTTLRPGALIFTLVELPYWQSSNAVRHTKQKSISDADYFYKGEELTDEGFSVCEEERLGIGMPCWKAQAPPESFSWTHKSLDYYVHKLQV